MHKCLNHVIGELDRNGMCTVSGISESKLVSEQIRPGIGDPILETQVPTSHR